MNRPGPYACIDVGYFDDERVALCPPLAINLHLRCLCYAASELTDGRIPGVIMRRLMRELGCRKRDVDRLLEVGLVERLGLVEGSGMADDYYLPAFLKWNPSREDRDRRRQHDRERQAAHRERQELKLRLRSVS